MFTPAEYEKWNIEKKSPVGPQGILLIILSVKINKF